MIRYYQSCWSNRTEISIINNLGASGYRVTCDQRRTTLKPCAKKVLVGKEAVTPVKRHELAEFHQLPPRTDRVVPETAPAKSVKVPLGTLQLISHKPNSLENLLPTKLLRWFVLPPINPSPTRHIFY